MSGREGQTPFRFRSSALRYAAARPHFHPLVVRRAVEYLRLRTPLARALDVGCGTGLSTGALTAIAQRVVGVDPSLGMMALAPAHPRIRYTAGMAESLPFEPRAFDLITVGQAVHWFDRGEFLTEARRALRDEGRLVIYDNYFSDEQLRSDRFREWHDSYLTKFPRRPRAELSFTTDDVELAGFRLLHCERLENVLPFTVRDLVEYLLTQSNVIAAVEGGGGDLGQARAWLERSLEPLFVTDRRTVDFESPIWYLRKSS